MRLGKFLSQVIAGVDRFDVPRIPRPRSRASLCRYLRAHGLMMSGHSYHQIGRMICRTDGVPIGHKRGYAFATKGLVLVAERVSPKVLKEAWEKREERELEREMDYLIEPEGE